MRMKVAAGLVLAVAGLAVVQGLRADDPPVKIPEATATLHVDLTPKVAATINNKVSVGDTCTLTNITKNAKTGLYEVTIVDSTPTTPVKAAGTLEETNQLANLDLKKLSKVSFKIAEGDKARGKDVVTLTTTETLPAK